MSTRLNGCHNRAPFRTTLVVQDGWFMDGVTRVPRMVAAPFRMAPDCRYTHTELGQADTGCTDCRHRHQPTNPTTTKENP